MVMMVFISMGTGLLEMPSRPIIDPEKEHVIRTSEFISLGKNTPFDGYKAKGVVVRTIVAGKTVYELN